MNEVGHGFIRVLKVLILLMVCALDKCNVSGVMLVVYISTTKLHLKFEKTYKRFSPICYK
jgi:hypothetical protein